MEVKKEGDKVTVTVQLGKGEQSSTGKSTILFSSVAFNGLRDSA